MQHVLRRWERQSDGIEYKKTLWRPGLCPGPHWGSLQRFHSPLVGGEGLAAPPQEPIPRSRPLPRLSYPHSKISSDAVGAKDGLRPRCSRHREGGMGRSVPLLSQLQGVWDGCELPQRFSTELSHQTHFDAFQPWNFSIFAPENRNRRHHKTVKRHWSDKSG